MKKYLILFLIFALMCSTSLTYANAYTRANGRLSVFVGDFNDNGTAEISGKFTTKEEGQLVTVTIFAPNKNAANLAPTIEQKDVLVFMDDTKSDQNGEFKIEVTLSGASGEYSAYFGPAESGETLERIPIYYSNKTENIAKLGELNAKAAVVAIDPATNNYVASDVADVESFVDTYKDALGFRFSLYEGINSVNHTEVIKTLIRHLKSEPFNTNDTNGASGVFRTLTFMRALTEDKVTDLDIYAAYLPVFTAQNGILKKWYDDASTQEKAEIITRLKNLSYTTIENFENKAVEAAVLTRIHLATGDGDVEDILQDFESYTNISTSGLTQTVYDGLERQNYANYAALSAAITELKKSPAPGGGSLGGGGGGGAGGGGGGGISTPNIAIDSGSMAENKPQKMEEKDGFKDVSENDWFYDAVYELYDRGIISGKSETSFEPESSITREEIVKMLAVLQQLTLDDEESVFTDVKKNDWFFSYVNAAAKAGIVNGVGDGVFGTGRNVTRQDIAVMLYNIAIKNGETEAQDEIKLDFTDAEEISDYAKNAVALLSKLKVINGYDDKSFRPQNNVTRAEAAKLIREFIYINK